MMMNYKNEAIEKLIPLLTGALGSLVLCAFIAVHSFINIEKAAATAVNEAEIYFEEILENSASLFLIETEKTQDPVLEYYRNPEYREWVIDFFAKVCSSREIAQAILDNCDRFDVPAALAFAVSWEESKFNQRAVNLYNKDGSIDRGLFQLNNRSFPNLEISDFFNVKSNARYGIGHLRYCLDTGGSEISALAMYNAGTGRVTTSGAPKVTLNYISRILENRGKIESRFHAMLIKEEEHRLAKEAEARARDAVDQQQQPYFSRTLRFTSPL